MDDEPVDDFERETPGMDELDDSWNLFVKLLQLRLLEKHKARLWAIAATDAEKLHAWIAYVLGVADQDTTGSGDNGD